MQARIDNDVGKLATLRDRIIRAMLGALQADDLPRFAVRFKELLNENTIREIADFQSQRKRERETIRERIATVNGSLQAIDYNPNRYIALEAELNVDADLAGPALGPQGQRRAQLVRVFRLGALARGWA